MLIEYSKDNGKTQQAVSNALPVSAGELAWGQSDKSEGMKVPLTAATQTIPFWTVSAGKTGHIKDFALFCDYATAPVVVILNIDATPVRWFLVSAAAPVQIEDLGLIAGAGQAITMTAPAQTGQNLYCDFKGWES